ncbi:MAG TPA: recombinase family protein [Streptosporangiaceae bacterium]|jgi:DNA invertase Pin-like site-specific DNA recombinase|nr:recombinase family protein [Streptosporangiaceae bacterium]
MRASVQGGFSAATRQHVRARYRRGLRTLAGMAMIGYARVSTGDQNPESQTARLRDRGCAKVFTDLGVSGKLAARPQWDACRAYLRDSDVLVVTKLDRIGRSVGNLVSVAADLQQRGVDLVVLDQAIDTATPAGRMLFHVLAAIAEFEHDLIAERTRDGLAAARARRGGKLPPRGPSISPDKLTAARQLYQRGEMPARRIAAAVGISRASLYRALPPGGRELSGRRQ